MGMTWATAGWKMAIVPGFFLAIAAYYQTRRPAETRLFEIVFYAGLWSALPPAGTQLTFAANAMNLPMQSDTFASMDAAIGFRWIDWARFVWDHPMLHWITNQAYGSYMIQPFAAVIILAIFGPPGRNSNLVIATIIAMTITTAVSALVPAVGPANAYGIRTPATEALIALREGQRAGLPYAGIICFPSFHTAMAVLFTAAYRGVPLAFPLAALVNAVMLLSVPASGDHYLVDLLAGIVVALGAQCAADRVSAP